MSSRGLSSYARMNSKSGESSLNWSFIDSKTTSDEITNTVGNIISCVEFNSDGTLLACGDEGGRISVFQASDDKSNEYDLYSTFQSHEAEFDYLKSIEIEEKINKICWLDESKTAGNHFMLATNDKTIKLWKLSERDRKLTDENTPLNFCSPKSILRLPKVLPVEPMVQSQLRRIFSKAHAFHINSVSINSDLETFISADELRINLWNLEVTDESFIIVDIKPPSMADLREVISAAEFHPKHCHIFAYSTSIGSIKLCDMRQAALCDQYSKIFQGPKPGDFFKEWTSVIGSLKFSHCGRYMITRDYMTVNVWDLNMDSGPIETYYVHEYLRNKLCVLYENEFIFDKFECSISHNDNYLMTGSYNLFKIIDRQTKSESMYVIDKDTARQRYLRPQKVITNENSSRKKFKKDEIFIDDVQLQKRIDHTAWNPTKNLIAVAMNKNLYLFHSK